MPFDPNSLHPLIVRNLTMMGYDEPRPIQAQAMGAILEGRDVIGLAQTGTGKTAAFAAPIVHHLLSSRPAAASAKSSVDPMFRLRALILCPTRELAQQVARETGRIAQGSVLRTACAYGKVAVSPQIKAIARGVDVLIATPGRVRELLEAGALSLAYVRHIAIDEADRMLDLGFLPQVTQILASIPAGRQTLLFTATMPGEIEKLAREHLVDPVRIEIGRHTTPVEHVNQHVLPVADEDKVALLLHLLADGERKGILIFCRTKRRVGWVGTALARNEISTGQLHGDRSQAARQKALDDFQERKLRVLVATEVASRGLHIPAVKTVINYDVPMTPEQYVHRIGRAAHGSRTVGEAFTLLSLADRPYWRQIEKAAGVDLIFEGLEGFKPTKPARGQRKPRVDVSDAASRRRPEPQRKSRKSRPIKKGQKPGGGVRKLST